MQNARYETNKKGFVMQGRIDEFRIVDDHGCEFCFGTGILNGHATVEDIQVQLMKICTHCDAAKLAYEDDEKRGNKG